MWKSTLRTTRRDADSPSAHLIDQVLLGGSIGMASGGMLALLLGTTGPMVAFGAVLGIFTGLVAGLLLWIGSADLPEDPILPVHAGDRRQARETQVRHRS
jgi:hypothetical protein